MQSFDDFLALPGAYPQTLARPTLPQIARIAQGGTPNRMSTSSISASNHFRSVINPFVKQDIHDHTLSVGHYIWIEAVTGIPEEKIRKWSRDIFNSDWFHDDTVSDAMERFCSATQETTRYQPFSDLANRVLAMARDKLDDVPAGFPVSDVKFFRNDPVYLKCHKQHGTLGALRKPDVLCIRDRVARSIESGPGNSPPGAEWYYVLLFAEFKYAQDLRALLKKVKNERRQGENSSTIDVGTCADDHTDAVAAPSSSNQGTRLQNDASPGDGKKRLYEEMNDEEQSSVSSSKRLKGSGIQASSTRLESEAAIQAASYALEVLSCTNGTRVYSLGLTLKDDGLTLWYYDASGLVKSTEMLSLITNFEDVVAVLIALACCTPRQWGAIPSLNPPKTISFNEIFPPSNLSGFSVDLGRPDTENAVAITLGAPIFCQYALVGRRTFVYEATSPHQSLSTRVFVAKFSQQVKSRRPEQEYVEIAVRAGITHVPEILFANDIWNLSDGPRGIFHRGGQPYEDRVLRLIVSSKYIPLQVVLRKHPEHLETMARQMLQCLHDLRYKAKILHRDVSVNNIMCEMRGDSFFFILNDFDLATVVTERGESTGATSKHRTGTLPFMAWEFTMNAGRVPPAEITHRLHHDFQSLYWAAMWCTGKVEPVTDKILRHRIDIAILRWEKGDFYDISSRKRNFFTIWNEFADFPMTPSFEGHRIWLKKWRLVFSEAIAEKARLENLDERCGGIYGAVDDAIMDDLVSLERIAKTVGWKDLATGSNASSFSSWLQWLLPSSLY